MLTAPKERHEAGVWERLRKKLCSTAWAGPLSTRRVCLLRAEKIAPNPTGRGKQGSKRHLVVERKGVSLAVGHTAANVRWERKA